MQPVERIVIVKPPVFNAGLKAIRTLWLRGRKLYCPICEKGCRAFLPTGTDRRLNAVCPGCGAFERHRLLRIAIQKLTHKGLLKTGGRLLHVAPEASIANKLATAADYAPCISIDLNSPEASVSADLTCLPFPDNSFDTVVCNHVLEHIPDDRTAMAELYRVMKPGSWGSIQVPMSDKETFEDATITDPAERERVFGQWDHVRLYGKDYPDRLSGAGFRVRLFEKEALVDPGDLPSLSIDCEQEVVFVWK